MCLASNTHKSGIFINIQILHGTYEMLPKKSETHIRILHMHAVQNIFYFMYLILGSFPGNHNAKKVIEHT